MRLSSNKTSNPAFNEYFWNDKNTSSNTLRVSGVIFKSIAAIVVVATVVGYVWKLNEQGVDVAWFRYGGIIGAIIFSTIISYQKHLTHIFIIPYAIAKGCFIGGFSVWIKLRYPELPFQAIGVTVFTFFTVFILYQTGIIVVTKKIRSIIITSAASIFLVYIISWILSIFGIRSFIWGTSWIAIAFNVFAAIIASMTLLLDFDYIEQKKHKAPKNMEWFAAWGLLVSLLWMYVEILRLMKKLAIRF